MTVNNLAVLERDEGNLDRAAPSSGAPSSRLSAPSGARHPHAVLARANRRALERERAATATDEARDPPQESRANQPMK
jgi:hypothetical protein